MPLAKIANWVSIAMMPTRNISLTPEQDAFVADIVEAGEYQNASEAVRDALRALQQRREHDKLKLELLRAQVALGVSALEHGDAVDVEDSELESYLLGLGRTKARTRRKRRR